MTTKTIATKFPVLVTSSNSPFLSLVATSCRQNQNQIEIYCRGIDSTVELDLN